jgi:hypothetical protein
MSGIDVLISQADVRASLDLRCLFLGDWAGEHEQEGDGVAPYHTRYSNLEIKTITAKLLAVIAIVSMGSVTTAALTGALY